MQAPGKVAGGDLGVVLGLEWIPSRRSARAGGCGSTASRCGRGRGRARSRTGGSPRSSPGSRSPCACARDRGAVKSVSANGLCEASGPAGLLVDLDRAARAHHAQVRPALRIQSSASSASASTTKTAWLARTADRSTEPKISRERVAQRFQFSRGRGSRASACSTPAGRGRGRSRPRRCPARGRTAERASPRGAVRAEARSQAISRRARRSRTCGGTLHPVSREISRNMRQSSASACVEIRHLVARRG